MITAITLVSRVLGYVRDQRIGYLLGTSVTGDSFVLAYRIPNLLRRLVAEGSMTASFVPVFAQYISQKEKAEWAEFANRMFWTLSIILAVLAVLGVGLSPLLVKLLTLGNDTVDIPLAILLNRIMWPYILFIGLAALAMAILNSFRLFAVPALAPVTLNLSIIAFSLLATRDDMSGASVLLAVGVLVGGILQLLIQLPLLRKNGIRLDFGISFSHPGIRRVGKLMVPGFVGIGVAQINFAVDTIFATHPIAGQGALVALQFADRVMELVLGGYAIAIATAILPMMSKQVAERNMEELRHTISFSLRLVSFITVPAMVGLVLLRRPIIQVLFEHGQFDRQSTLITAWALLFFALGLPWFAVTKIIVPAFYSTQDTRTPVKVAFVAMIANVAFNLLFLKPLQNAGPAAATSLAGLVNFAILYVIFQRRHGDIGSRELAATLAKVATATAIMGLAVWLILQFSGLTGPGGELHGPLLQRTLVLVGILATATGVYFLVSWLLRSEELRELYALKVRQKA